MVVNSRRAVSLVIIFAASFLGPVTGQIYRWKSKSICPDQCGLGPTVVNSTIKCMESRDGRTNFVDAEDEVNCLESKPKPEKIFCVATLPCGESCFDTQQYKRITPFAWKQ